MIILYHFILFSFKKPTDDNMKILHLKVYVIRSFFYHQSYNKIKVFSVAFYASPSSEFSNLQQLLDLLSIPQSTLLTRLYSPSKKLDWLNHFYPFSAIFLQSSRLTRRG